MRGKKTIKHCINPILYILLMQLWLCCFCIWLTGAVPLHDDVNPRKLETFLHRDIRLANHRYLQRCQL